MELEQFFTPTRRLQDKWEENDDTDPFEYAELALALPLEEFLNYRWGWEDLWAFASADVLCKVLWITDITFILVGNTPDHIYSGDFPYKYLSVASSRIASGKVQTLALYLTTPI